jgi:hypothetical protein
MTDCCEYKCTQGRDCPVRKQRIEATNQAYINRVDTDPYIDTISTFKALIAVIAVTGAVTLLAFILWGK